MKRFLFSVLGLALLGGAFFVSDVNAELTMVNSCNRKYCSEVNVTCGTGTCQKCTRSKSSGVETGTCDCKTYAKAQNFYSGQCSSTTFCTTAQNDKWVPTGGACAATNQVCCGQLDPSCQCYTGNQCGTLVDGQCVAL